MNLVEIIKNQISGEILEKLSSLIGGSESTTRSALGAAIPALLGALSNVTSTGGGAQKLASAIGNLDTGSVGDISHMLSGNPAGLLDKGSSLLNSLFGGNALSGLVSSLANFTGLGGSSVQKLIAYLAPMVLGIIASRLGHSATNPNALANLFNEQKSNIANALPAGISLPRVPGMATAGAAARAAVGTAEQAGSSLLKWLLPAIAAIAALALLAFFLWPKAKAPEVNLPPAPRVPEVAHVSLPDVTGTVRSLTDSLNGITDVASVDAALPKLKDLSAKLDGIKDALPKMPEAERSKVVDSLRSSLGNVESQFAKLMWIPGASEKIKPMMNEILGKFSGIDGLTVSSLPTLSGDLAGAVHSVTDTLTNVKDAATAKSALPSLQEVGDKIDNARATMDRLPESSKGILSSLLKPAVAKLKDLVATAMTRAGIAETLRPTLEAIMTKLEAMAG
jgi:hypothetical protein